MFIIFALLKYYFFNLKIVFMIKLNLNDLEAEFIHAVRNYKKAFPNGSNELEWYINCLKKIKITL